MQGPARTGSDRYEAGSTGQLPGQRRLVVGGRGALSSHAGHIGHRRFWRNFAWHEDQLLVSMAMMMPPLVAR